MTSCKYAPLCAVCSVTWNLWQVQTPPAKVRGGLYKRKNLAPIAGPARPAAIAKEHVQPISEQWERDQDREKIWITHVWTEKRKRRSVCVFHLRRADFSLRAMLAGGIARTLRLSKDLSRKFGSGFLFLRDLWPKTPSGAENR